MFENGPYSVQDVFTPTKPARFTFVERESINNKLVAALRTPGKQIVVYGHSGSGKTTLLVNKLTQLYENHITTRCFVGLRFNQLLLDAFDQLGSFYEAERISTETSNLSSSLEAEYLGLKAKLGVDDSEERGSKRHRVLPPQLTPQTLARLMGAARCCWVLEDFHKIEPREKRKLAQVMKVFMDMSDDYPDLRVIAIGAVGTARQVIEYDAEMRNRVSEIFVPLMTDEEIKSIPKKGEPYLNIHIEEGIKNDLVNFSNGLASVCHQLCLNMCFAADVSVTSRKTRIFRQDLFDQAVEHYLEDSSDTLKSAFDKALRQTDKTEFNDVRLIVEALLQVDQDGTTRPVLLDKVQDQEKEYPIENLDNHLTALQEEQNGRIIRYDNASGRYSFTDPFYRAFALALIGKERSKELPELVSSAYESKWVLLFDDLITLSANQSTSSEESSRPRVVPKMDWSASIFKGKRKGPRARHK